MGSMPGSFDEANEPGLEVAPDSRPRLALAAVLEAESMLELPGELEQHGLEATLFPSPQLLVQSSRSFSPAHELGNGALVDASLDGELGRWTLANLEAELDEADDLLQELGFGVPSSVFLPGHRHLTAEGPYRRRVQLRYPISVSPAPAGCSVFGARRGIQPISLGHTNLDDLAPLLTSTPPARSELYILLIPGEPALKPLRKAVFGLLAQRAEAWQIGPLRNLVPALQAAHAPGPRQAYPH
jgi:hypothetical protein